MITCDKIKSLKPYLHVTSACMRMGSTAASGGVHTLRLHLSEADGNFTCSSNANANVTCEPAFTLIYTQ